MRKSFFSAAILATLLSAGFATAEQSSGKITAVDSGAQTVTLNDGTVYAFDKTTRHHECWVGICRAMR